MAEIKTFYVASATGIRVFQLKVTPKRAARIDSNAPGLCKFYDADDLNRFGETELEAARKYVASSHAKVKFIEERLVEARVELRMARELLKVIRSNLKNS